MVHPASEIPFLSAIGFGAASFWRGAWYTMDAALFPDSTELSCASSLGLGFGGFAALHVRLQRLAAAPPLVRGGALYVAALANVAAWRGVWMGWDLLTQTGTASAPSTPDEVSELAARLKFTRSGQPVATLDRDEELRERRRTLYSGLASHFGGLAVLVGSSHLCSAMAPPARIGVLSDFMHHGAKPSSYLPDIAMFVNKKF